ncbi:hypothetical protein I9Y19_001455 [Citrobacter freundii]|uniref:Uncharacterized protein n=1 Tax=Citrobacter freundii TaxID=546 RepID=A0ABY7KZB1_CITFR|nr:MULTISPECIES: hypothetical protein [Citrobacter]EIJ9081968.1 hypothetical protein [Citrobacter freundii]EJH9548005.1 hypothetical protein [Citrobacter freundii]EJO6483261.1 hypothetical protein [Citrobacter freundii]EKW5686361.1 hypothetical protein [Citrobacter freundii]EKX5706034.1 hypothetical protein [Citrobacter freundii]
MADIEDIARRIYNIIILPDTVQSFVDSIHTGHTEDKLFFIKIIELVEEQLNSKPKDW